MPEEYTAPIETPTEADPTEATPTEETPIPEKFQNEDGTLNQDALLKSYGELESRPAPVPEVTEPQSDDFEANMAKWSDEWVANDGKLSEDTYKDIAAAHGVSEEFVGRYMAGEQALANQAAAEVHDMVGGKDEYTKMLQWVAKTDGREAAETFVRDLGVHIGGQDSTKIKLAMEGVMARYKQATGKGWAPSLTGIDAGGQAIKPFASRFEMQAAMSEKGYKDGDPKVHEMFDLRHRASKEAGIF